MEPDRGVSSKVWIATAISSCVVVVHFHHTQRVKAPSADLVIPLLGQNGHVPKKFQPKSDGVWELTLTAPLATLAKSRLTVSVRDRQGNISRIERTLSVGKQ